MPNVRESGQISVLVESVAYSPLPQEGKFAAALTVFLHSARGREAGTGTLSPLRGSRLNMKDENHGKA